MVARLKGDIAAPSDPALAEIRQALFDRLVHYVGKDRYSATPRDWLHAAAYVVRDRLIERYLATGREHYRHDVKSVYYLSLEFLIGRTLTNSLLNLGLYEPMRAALAEAGVELEELEALEYDAALGNGGLGRLAACILDALATLDLPGYGYGIRYEYGSFTQRIENGYQVEHPENWLRYGNPWEFARPEVLYPVRFYGRVVEYVDEHGIRRCHWVDTQEVMAMAFDTPVAGFGGSTVSKLRLWSARATRDFDLAYFNEGNYIRAVAEKNESENLSRVLYPDDSTAMGRELRLKQEYFFVSASLQDILARHLRHHGAARLDTLPDKAAIHLNDTHPAIAIPELMRLLVDVHGLDWDRAWSITQRTFSYTNHTLMPEALETWPVGLFERVLPRHLQIIYEINYRFLKDVAHRYPGDVDLLRRVSFIDETGERYVRMAHLAIVGSHTVNGVSELHTRLLGESIFADFARLYPGKLVSKTNGVTPRRWLNQANPRLAALITERLGGAEWLTDLDRLRRLEPLAEDPGFQAEFRAIKRANKERLAGLIERRLKLKVSHDALFDVQVKRIHEYKRQLLNVLHVVTLYNRLRTDADYRAKAVPRVVIFAGKAAPSYFMAKLVIKLIHEVADVVNHDPAVDGRLQVVFLPNYDVSTAMEIIPAADLSEQISTAGTEASGTGNMKLALNGALTIGTWDGANLEIREAVGAENIFLFGLRVDEVAALRARGYDPWAIYHANAELRQALDMIGQGYFVPEQPRLFAPLVDSLTHGGDRFLLLADYASYLEAQAQVEALYRDPAEWTRRAILNVARMGRFSIDRTVREYADEIWNVQPLPHDSDAELAQE